MNSKVRRKIWGIAGSTAVAALLSPTWAAPATLWQEPSQELAQNPEQAVESGRVSLEAAVKLEEFLQTLQDLRTRIEVEGADIARNRLQELRLLATAVEGLEEKREALIRVALVGADLYLRLGLADQALRALQDPLLSREEYERVDPGALPDGSVTKGQPSEELREAIQAALRDKRLVERRLELEEALPEQAQDSLEDLVVSAFEATDYVALTQIGAPAQPIVGRLILRGVDEFPSSYEADPLNALIEMDPGGAASFLLSHLNAGGYIWKKRIIRCMEESRVVARKSSWTRTKPFIPLEPDWHVLLAALLTEADTQRPALAIVRQLALCDLLGPVQESLVAAVRTGDDVFVNELLAAIDWGAPADSAQPILEAIVLHKSGRVQRIAAEALSQFESSAALASLVDHPDARLRRALAKTLGRHEGVKLFTLGPGVTYAEQLPSGSRGERGKLSWKHSPDLGHAERELLQRLAQDTDAEVRMWAANGIGGLTEPVEEAAYETLVRDPNPNVRAQMIEVRGISKELRSRLLAQLASDKLDWLLKTLDDYLLDAGIEVDPTPYMAALEKRLRSAPAEKRRNMMRKLTRTERGREWLVAQTLDEPSDVLLDTLLEVYRSNFRPLARVSDENLAGLLVRLASSDWAFTGLLTAVGESEPPRVDALIRVMDDARAPRIARLHAASLANSAGGDAYLGSLTRLLVDLSSGARLSAKELTLASETASHQRWDERNRTCLKLLDNSNVLPRLVDFWLKNFDYRDDEGSEVARRIVEHASPPNSPYPAGVNRVLEAMEERAQLFTEGFVLAAFGEPKHRDEAMQVLVSRRDAKYLGELAAYLSSTDMDSYYANVAADGVASFYSDEAARVLLTGLTSPDESIRTACADGLDQIETFRTRSRRWEQLSQGMLTREDALVDLVSMLDHPNEELRIAAIQGIGAFGALEYLPTIIRLLADDSVAVQAAARETIDHLRKMPPAPVLEAQPDSAELESESE